MLTIEITPVIEEQVVDIELEIRSPVIEMELIAEATYIMPSDYDFYDGDYEFTPEWDDIVLDTTNKILSDDIDIHPIPVYRTSNPQGGNTVFIGGLQTDADL